MSKRLALLATTAFVLLTPNLALAQETANNYDVGSAVALAAGFGMAIAAAGCGIGQSRAIAAALEGIARNPSAAGPIRASMIFGLVLIESLAIYALLIAILLIFNFAPEM